MRHSLRLLIALGLLTSLVACDARQADTASARADGDTEAAGAPVLQADPVEIQIVDERGFGQPLVALRAELPGDWRTEGGMSWNRNSECVANHFRLQWRGRSPDGRRSLELMPGLSWQVLGTDIPMNPCPPLAARNAQNFLLMVAQRYPGARVLGFRDRPDLAESSAPANGAHVEMTAGELSIAYPSGAGEVREILTATLTTSEYQGNVCIGVPMVLAYRVIGGDPDPAVSDRFLKSMQVDRDWQARMQQVSMQLVAQISERQRQGIASWHADQMGRISARGAADRAQIRMQTNREVAQIYSNTWSNGMATDERIQRRTLESIGEYNTYADPASGGVVRESTDYNRVLRTEDGNYISTNDPYLAPAGSEELQREP